MSWSTEIILLSTHTQEQRDNFEKKFLSEGDLGKDSCQSQRNLLTAVPLEYCSARAHP